MLRPVNNMIEFKQIIGRGSRLFEGKGFFRIIDFTSATRLIDEWEVPKKPEGEEILEPEEPFVKKISNTAQRTVTKTPEPMPIVPLNFFQINQEKDPVMIAKENQFRQMLQESERRRNKLEGLAYLMGFKE